METEERSGPSRGFLLALGLGGILLIGLVAAELVVPLQPPLQVGCTSCAPSSGATVIIPAGTGSNTKLNYVPATATVVVGLNNTVTFVNEDSVVHTVTATNKAFDSGDIKPGASWTYNFTSPGTYSYYCIYHSAWMKGTITVTGPSGVAVVKVVIPAGTATDVKQSFQPAMIVVVIGVNNTVSWVNEDTAPHTVTAADNSFNSGNLVPGATFTHTFTTPGTYPYSCSYHSWMKGTVVVEAKS
ncbi:MAG TPA: cupredoxin domain-containing protein [Nitrososphaerales archaeon]|nr:cupredoxin domain-containing protein [Nitrososphaerales archaeon]